MSKSDSQANFLYFEKFLLASLGLMLLWRIFCQTFLQGFGPLGANKMGDLSTSVMIFGTSNLYFIKKLWCKENIALPQMCLALVFFGIISTISIFHSEDAPSSLQGIIFLWSFIIMVMMLINLLKSLEQIKILMFFLIVIALISSLEAIYEYFFQLPWYLSHATPAMLDGNRDLAQLIVTHRTPTLFLWPNALSGVLIMIFPFIVGFMVSSKQVYSQLRFSVAAVIVITALYLELSISCWVSLLLASLTVFFFTKHFSGTHFKRWRNLSFFLLALLSVVVIVRKISLSHDNSYSSRMVFFGNAVSLIAKHPWVGDGWNAFATASAPYTHGIDQWTSYVHNIYLQVFCDTGVWGILSFIFLLSILGKAMWHLKDQRHPSQWIILAMLVGVLAALIDNCFSYTMLLPSTALFWWMMVAILVALEMLFKPSGGILLSSFKLRSFFVIINILLCGFACRLAVAEYDYFTALTSIHKNLNQASAIALFENGSRLNPWDKKFELAEAVAYEELFYKTRDREYLKAARQLASQTRAQSSLGEERQALINRLNAQGNA